MVNILILICVLFWGISTFLSKISVNNVPPLLMQSISGLWYILLIPIAVKSIGKLSNIKFDALSIGYAATSTLLSLAANVILCYAMLNMKGNNTSSTVLISLYPVITFGLSAIFLNEQLTLTKVGGILIMIFGAIIMGIK